MPPKQLTRQIEIIHLSDIHFGVDHRFVPPKTPDGDRAAGEGIPKLIEKLQEDLGGEDSACPVIVCITGDITTTASYNEFEEAEEFLKSLAQTTIYGCQQSMKSLFVVPGNHDVNYEGKSVGERWQHWVEFNNRLYETAVKREDPWALAKVHDLIDDFGIVVLCLNSCIYIEKDKPSEKRGELDDRQLLKIKKELQQIDPSRLESAIRVALIHHHPVLIPALVEKDRGYDAVLRADKLLTILHKFGFHLLLHGHKHYPLTFLEDIDAGFLSTDEQPIMVVAGGSVGSTGLPDHPRKSNCYNRITVKWHPAAGQTRIRVVTRGLSLYDEGIEKLPGEWEWQMIKQDDKSFYKWKPFPSPHFEAFQVGRSPIEEAESPDEPTDSDKNRKAKYKESRGNMAVVEVMPSLKPNMAYEARCWIVRHPGFDSPENVPEEVTWSAGPKFPSYTIPKETDENFCGIFNYWGPMLIEGLLKFAEGEPVTLYIYARMPAKYDPLLTAR